jgi:tetraacyldisaccharide 4'-kinase
MTEKDAVKCEPFAGPNFWYLAVKVSLPAALESQLVETIVQLVKTRRAEKTQ